MPGVASGKHEAGRIRQQRYRQRLAIKAEPEVNQLDTAAAIAVAHIVSLIEAGEANGSIKDLLNRSLTAAIGELKIRGYAGPASVRLLNRRISSLRLGIAGKPRK